MCLCPASVRKVSWLYISTLYKELAPRGKKFVSLLTFFLSEMDWLMFLLDLRLNWTQNKYAVAARYFLYAELKKNQI